MHIGQEIIVYVYPYGVKREIGRRPKAVRGRIIQITKKFACVQLPKWRESFALDEIKKWNPVKELLTIAK